MLQKIIEILLSYVPEAGGKISADDFKHIAQEILDLKYQIARELWIEYKKDDGIWADFPDWLEKQEEQ